MPIESKKKLKNNQELFNPCLKEQELTYKCFNDNNFDKDACVLQINNYKTCKGFWNSVRLQRKKDGIVPHLPPVEEREEIKRKYFERCKQS